MQHSPVATNGLGDRVCREQCSFTLKGILGVTVAGLPLLGIVAVIALI